MDDVNERLREAACVGDLNLLSKLLTQGASINDKNAMNGWTPLHWACKRNHVSVVSHLLHKGADANITNKDGQMPAQLASNSDILDMFGEAPGSSVKSNLPITPNYMANPTFPYLTQDTDRQLQPVAKPAYDSPKSVPEQRLGGGDTSSATMSYVNGRQHSEELVLKVRLANCEEKDYIEVELDEHDRTFSSLMDLMCTELGVDRKLVHKIRKLPDTIVRKDKDVGRLRDFQELELVLTNKAMSATSRTYSLEPARNHETILY